MHVRVDPHSPAWAARFEAEAARVADALDGALIEIHHIGNTAVPGLDAKPVIDMMPVATDLAAVDGRRRRRRGWPRHCLMVTFGLAHRLDAPRIAVATEPYPDRWTHHVLVEHADEIDDELTAWLREAHAFSLSKR